MFGSNAKFENDNKSTNVKRGLKTMAEKGLYPCPAPIGYLNEKYAPRGTKKLYPDPERHSLVRRVFDHVLSQKYTVPQTYKMIVADGLRMKSGKPISRSNFYYMLNNPFYYGEFEYPLKSGLWHKGVHQPTISYDEYQKVQLILGNKAKGRLQKHDFTFKGLMKCGQCGAMITCEKKTKRPKNGKVHEYIYYHCTKMKDPNCPQGSIEEKALVQQIDKTLEQIEIPASFHQWAFKWFQRVHADEIASQKKDVNHHHTAYAKIVEKIGNLVDMRANGEIDQDTFVTKNRHAREEHDRLKSLLDDTDRRVITWLDKAEQLFDFAEHARERFVSGTPEVRREILRALDSNLYIKDKMFRPDMTNVLLQLKSVQTEYQSKKNIFEPVDQSITSVQKEALYEANPIMLPC